VDTLEAQRAQSAVLEQRMTVLEESSHRMEELLGSLDTRAQATTQAMGEIAAALQRLAASVASANDNQPPPSRPHGPDPDTVYAVPVGNSPFRGPRDAKVTIIRSYEFACPFCERSRGTMDELLKRYGKDLRIVYKHFIVHPQVASTPAYAVCAAHKQGKFFEMENALWERAYKAGRDFSPANMEAIARGLGLDMRRFLADMNSPACADEVRDDQALLSKVGARGTPAFFINGRPLSGARPADMFATIIDEELARANKAIKAGIKQRSYYDHIVKTGKDSL
jgi:protein-disulfide isomerase